MDVTNVDLRPLTLGDFTTKDELLTFTGADTYVKGTILARDSVSGKMIAYVIGGVGNEDSIPKAVLAHDVTAAGAGDKPCRIITAGEVQKELLVVDADGDDSNLTNAILDQLRDYSIVATSVTDNSVLDNQA